MVNNFHKVMNSLQIEINESLAKLKSNKKMSNKRYILERAASEMLTVINSKKITASKKPYSLDFPQ